jgi:hypothetical protein
MNEGVLGAASLGDWMLARIGFLLAMQWTTATP